MVKLYTHPMSNFAQRVHIALLEKNIEWESVVLDMVKKEHKSDSYLAINPYGRVPAIDDDGFILLESSAILGYLEQKHPTPALVPADDQGKAQVWMHIKLCDIQLGRHLGVIMFPKRFLPEEKWNKEAMSKAARMIEKHLTIMDTQLQGKTYLVQDRFTLADLAYAPLIQFLPLTGITLPANVDRWARNLLQRPSIVQTRPPDAPKWS